MQCAVLSAKLLVITLCHIKLGEPGCQVMQTTCIDMFWKRGVSA